MVGGFDRPSVAELTASSLAGEGETAIAFLSKSDVGRTE
ncbi:hypothetical protein CKA32_000537 [Geitlerinema sp. FC II]|nr:hypothetical protein CKA32_000537 [Geitlerinema sp. FC II]